MCRAVEPHDVGEEAQEPGVRQVATLREQRAEVRTAVLEPGPGIAHAEAHGGGLGRHAELVQQPDEAGIVRLVVDDEPGVHRVVDTVELDVDRVGVTAGAGVGLEDGQVVAAPEPVRGDEARHTGSHDRDLHSGGSLPIPPTDGAVTTVTGPAGARPRWVAGQAASSCWTSAALRTP